MRRVLLLVALVALAMVVASGVANDGPVRALVALTTAAKVKLPENKQCQH